MNALIQVARNASPYLVVELLLPGGSVIALLLWLFRHRFKKGAGPLGTPRVGRCSWIRGLASPRGFGFMRFRGASGALETPGSGVAVFP
jgi:hypothetical protein